MSEQARLSEPAGALQAAAGEAGMSALVIDDNPGDQYLVQRHLRRLGLNVSLADNVDDALSLAAEARPDIVFVDVMLPRQSGYLIAQRVREMYPDTYLPVVFVASFTSEDIVLRCFEAGGDDVLSKPISEALLRAKITAVVRARRLHHLVGEQRDALQSYQSAMEHDIGVAKSILDNFSTAPALAAPNVRYMLRPMETLNGDFIMSALKPCGAQCFILGDFTGHGLPAAIGALVVHDTFCSMVRKGLDIELIAREINRKMYMLLPTDRFLSAALIELDVAHGTCSIWNGGLPDIYVLGQGGDIKLRHPSGSLPLGILESAEFEALKQRVALQPGDRVIAYSDGIIEANNPSGTLFGSDRLERCLATAADNPIEEIAEALAGFAGSADQRDDWSVLSISCEPEILGHHGAAYGRQPVRKPAMNWRTTLTLDHHAIKADEPRTALIGLADTLQGLGQRASDIHQIVNELTSALVDYGLLRMNLPDGATVDILAWENERRLRLKALDHGGMDIALDHRPTLFGGELRIRISVTNLAPDDDEQAACAQQFTAAVANRQSALQSRIPDFELTQCDPARLVIVSTYSWTNTSDKEQPAAA